MILIFVLLAIVLFLLFFEERKIKKLERDIISEFIDLINKYGEDSPYVLKYKQAFSSEKRLADLLDICYKLSKKGKK